MLNYRPLAYTTPDGTRLEFSYDGAINDETNHNLGEFTFASSDGKHYQDKTIATGVYSFNIKLNNENDLRELREALNAKALPESPGILEHPDPTLGTFDVVVSKYSVSQNALKGKNIITIKVDFFKTINDLLAGDVDNASNPASAQNSLSSIGILNEQQAGDFENSAVLDNGNGFSALVKAAIATANDAKAKLEFIALQVDLIGIAFNNAYADIITNADQLARSPFVLAQKMQNLIQLPMAAVESVRDRIASYQEFVDDSTSFEQTDLAEIEAGSPAGVNILAMKGIAALAGISAINYSAVSGQSVSIDKVKSGEQYPESGYLNKSEIIDTINVVLSSALSTTEILSEKSVNFGSNIFFTQYFDYSILNRTLVSSTVRNLNARIFSATAQKSIILDKETSIIKLSAELYGSVELSAINFLKDSNDLHGDSLFLVPQGKEIIYY